MTAPQTDPHFESENMPHLDTRALRKKALRRSRASDGLGLGRAFLKLLGFWFAGFLLYACYISFTQENENYQAEAIIVVTGSEQRVEEGLRLLRQNAAGRLLISGVNTSLSKDVFARTYGIKDPKILQKITLGYQAKNTASNAQEAKKWIEKEAYNSIILVTANYHLPRSAIEFHAVLPDTEIFLHSVTLEDEATPSYWPFIAKPKIMLTEYHKIYVSICRFLVARGVLLAEKYNLNF